MSQPKVLGAVDLSAATPTNVFAALTDGAMFNLRLTNRGSVDATVEVSITSVSATITLSGIVTYGQVIPANGTFEITGLAVLTEYCVVQSDVANVNAIAYGVGL